MLSDEKAYKLYEIGQRYLQYLYTLSEGETDKELKEGYEEEIKEIEALYKKIDK